VKKEREKREREDIRKLRNDKDYIAFAVIDHSIFVVRLYL